MHCFYLLHLVKYMIKDVPSWAHLMILLVLWEIKKKNFMTLFYGWSLTTSRLEPLWGGSLLLLLQFNKFPKISGNHFVDLKRMNTISRYLFDKFDIDSIIDPPKTPSHLLQQIFFCNKVFSIFLHISLRLCKLCWFSS